MRYTLSLSILHLLIPSISLADDPPSTSSGSAAVHWPQFRGTAASGIASSRAAPVKWNTTTGENVKWKTPIPGLGHSSPVIWGDRIFVTTAVREGGEKELRVGLYGDIAPVDDESAHSFRTFCLDKKTGKIIWEQTAFEGVPKVKRHTKATHANCTPATDGKHLVVFFGSEGLYCYDMDGKLLWKKDLGVLDSGYWVVKEAQWEFASSPIIWKDRVIVQCDVQKDSFLAAYDLKDGKELWRTPRTDVPTWSTPAVIEPDGRPELIANGYHHIGGYDPMTGKELWKMGGGADIPVPTPIFAHGLIFITSSHSQPQPIYAVRPGASGDISLKEGEKSNQYIAWAKFGQAPYMQTPIVVGDYLYTCKDNGIMACWEAKTGDRKYNMRIGSGSTGFTASAVSDGKNLYYTSEEGEVYVFPAGPEQPKEPLSINPMGEVCMATPAISEGRIYIRGQGHVFAVGE